MYLLLTIYFYYKDGKTVHKKEKAEEITAKNICSQGGKIQEMCGETHLPSAVTASMAGVGLGGWGRLGLTLRITSRTIRSLLIILWVPCRREWVHKGESSPLGESSCPPGTLKAWSAQPGQMH